jgi:membrane-bound serine protease (ClpP class)
VEFLLEPNVAYVVLLAGALFSLMAIVSPGSGLFEIAALFFLALAGYAIYNLEFNAWSLAVLVLSIVPFVYALRRQRSAVPLALAVLMLVVGSVFLFSTERGAPAVNPLVALTASSLVSGILWIAVQKSLQAAHAMPVHDLAGLVGQLGESRTEIHADGSVQVAGELWSARSENKISVGRQVRVVRREGFVLIVAEVGAASPS